MTHDKGLSTPWLDTVRELWQSRGWATTLLGNAILDIQNGLALRQSREGPGLPVTRIETIAADTLSLTRVGYVERVSEEQELRYRLQAGDVLFSHINSEPQLGRSVVYAGDPAYLLHGMNLLRIRLARQTMLPEFADHLFRFYRANGVFMSLASRAVGQSSINQGKLRALIVPLPPLSEQRAIAAVLNAVQRAIEASGRVIAATQQLKRSLMHYVFTYGPVPLDEAAQVPLQDTAIGAMPADWRTEPLGNLTRIVSGGTPDRREPGYWKGSIPWVKSGEIDYKVIKTTAEAISDLGIARSSARVLPEGTVLMAMYGDGVTRGRVGVLGIDAAINQACAAFLTGPDLCPPYLYWALVRSYDFVRSLGHGANQKNLSARLIGGVPCPVPTITEQEQITHLLTPVDRKLAAEESRAAGLGHLFRSLLEQCMTGRLRVPPGAVEALGAATL